MRIRTSQVKEFRRAQHNFKLVVHIVQEVFGVHEAHLCSRADCPSSRWLAQIMPHNRSENRKESGQPTLRNGRPLPEAIIRIFQLTLLVSKGQLG
jgi:hypothetical protein